MKWYKEIMRLKKGTVLYKLLLGMIFGVILSGCQQKTHVIPDIEKEVLPNTNQDVVILLHGMWRSNFAMFPAAEYLSSKGYRVINISYPSTEYSIEMLANNYLHPVIKNIHLNNKQKIHFVTHSMGGIIVRYYLKNNSMPSLGRVVMLSPPNQGTELADLVIDTNWFKERTGPSGKQLATHKGSLVKQLGSVEFELGVVAGNYNPNWITSSLISGPDDGVVSVESTKVDGMKDFILVSERHFKLRGHKPVLQQVSYFLEHGRFFRTSLL